MIPLFYLAEDLGPGDPEGEELAAAAGEGAGDLQPQTAAVFLSRRRGVFTAEPAGAETTPGSTERATVSGPLTGDRRPEKQVLCCF